MRTCWASPSARTAVHAPRQAGVEGLRIQTHSAAAGAVVGALRSRCGHHPEPLAP
jgi:hypothetical protein